MNPNDLAVILERIAELVEGKMAVSRALSQVASEMRGLTDYCNENRVSIPQGRLRTLHLKEMRYKG